MHLHRWLLPCVLLVSACADETANAFTPEPDAGVDVPQSPADAGFDAAVDRPVADALPAVDQPAVDARDVATSVDAPLFADSGARTPVCSACTGADDCGSDGVCVQVSSGARACLPRCNPDVPVCPGRLRCVRDVTLADVAVCAPLGGPCCLDGDNDGYGQGVGCMGPDCDDADPARTGAAMEQCNNVDDDCDGVVDEEPSRACSTACGGGPSAAPAGRGAGAPRACPPPRCAAT
nr:hypothetical protein [Deltaproteobacteria bacterium]